MDFRIINNLSAQENHAKRIKTLFNESDTVMLTSPFLMNDFADFFSEVDLAQMKKLHLVTTLPPKSFDQIKKIGSLVSFIEFPDFKERNIEIRISLNNRLHGKVYIFKRDGTPIAAIISSANFTDSGLTRNDEWGVDITDHVEIKELESTILDSIDYLNLSTEQIHRMQRATNEFLASQPQAETQDIDLSLIDLIPSPRPDDLFSGTLGFWLKPIGVTEHPVPEDRLFDKLDDELNFSKMRPTGVKPDDILIAYGVGTTKVLSVYRATSSPISVTKEEIADAPWLERWPWYVQARNLTPKFGASWPKYNLWINALKTEFHSLNPEGEITAVGGKTLGALNYGKDKLKLSPEFAKFIINKVNLINNGS